MNIKPICNYLYLVKDKKNRKVFLTICDYRDEFVDGDFYIVIDLIKSSTVNNITGYSSSQKIVYAKFQEYDFAQMDIIDSNIEIIEELGYFEDILKIKNTTEDYSSFKNSISPTMIDDFFENLTKTLG